MMFIAVDEDGTHIPLPDLDHIGAYIRGEREARGMSLRDLARKLGVQRQAVWSWEVGRANPSMERLAEIVKLFEADDDPDDGAEENAPQKGAEARMKALEEAESILGV